MSDSAEQHRRWGWEWVKHRDDDCKVERVSLLSSQFMCPCSHWADINDIIGRKERVGVIRWRT